MTVQKKLPSDIEENIQNLAGDIYLQIEDKITALLTSYSDNVEVSSETITTHPIYTALEEQYKSKLLSASQNQQEKNTELDLLKVEHEAQQSQLIKLQEDLSNAENLNKAKLTDSEQVLKDKLAENSKLTKQVAILNQESESQLQQCKVAELATDNATKKFNELALEKDLLAKNDKAKAATLAVQNQQYSDLQLKFDQISSELEYLKAEQAHKLLSSNEQLTHEQQQVSTLHEQISSLQKALKDKQVNLDKQQATISKIEHENNDLGLKVNSLEKAITQGDKNAVLAQQKYEVEKQKINNNLLNEQEKNAEILKQSSKDSEKIIKQLHEAERSKKVFENNLKEVNKELSLLKSQHQQAIKTEKSLKEQVQKEQALSMKLGDDNLQLKTTLEKAKSEHATIKKQQANQIIELTKTLDKTLLESESIQKIITQLEQKNDEKVDKINQLTSQSEKVQLQHKKALEKQTENHERLMTGHQKVLSEKNEALIELQRLRDKAESELSSQLEIQAKHAALESSKLSEIEASYAKAKDEIVKIEKALTQKQQELTAVQTELNADREKAANNLILHRENKGKQEVEYNKARETIKYLRDENTELNRKLEQQINDLEDKLTEYRLRFEYAQKELTKVNK